MYPYLMVFIGGGLGSIFRFGIAQALRPYATTFPWATFGANALSCIVLGALVGINLKGDLQASTRLLLMTGFCGGFSTFSTFTNETYQLLSSGAYSYALVNVLGSLLLCLGCIFLGLKLAA